jgi:hypothetical protein
MIFSFPLLLLTALIVRTLRADGAVRTLGYTFPFLVLASPPVLVLVVATPFEFLWETAALPVFGLAAAAVLPLPQTVSPRAFLTQSWASKLEARNMNVIINKILICILCIPAPLIFGRLSCW